MRSSNASSSNTRSSDNSSSSFSTEKESLPTFRSRISRKLHVADAFYKFPHLYRDDDRNVSSSSTGTVRHNPHLQSRPFLEHVSLFTPTQLVTPRPKFSQCTFASIARSETSQPRDHTINNHKSAHKFAPLSSSPPEFRPSFMRNTTPDRSERGKSRCPVCLEGFTKKVAVQPCNHALCSECFAHWQMHCYGLKKYASCPECTTEVDDIKWLPWVWVWKWKSWRDMRLLRAAITDWSSAMVVGSRARLIAKAWKLEQDSYIIEFNRMLRFQ